MLSSDFHSLFWEIMDPFGLELHPPELGNPFGWHFQGFWRSREWAPGWMTFKVDGLEIVECPDCSKNLGEMKKHMETTW